MEFENQGPILNRGGSTGISTQKYSIRKIGGVYYARTLQRTQDVLATFESEFKKACDFFGLSDKDKKQYLTQISGENYAFRNPYMILGVLMVYNSIEPSEIPDYDAEKILERGENVIENLFEHFWVKKQRDTKNIENKKKKREESLKVLKGDFIINFHFVRDDLAQKASSGTRY